MSRDPIVRTLFGPQPLSAIVAHYRRMSRWSARDHQLARKGLRRTIADYREMGPIQPFKVAA